MKNEGRGQRNPELPTANELADRLNRTLENIARRASEQSQIEEEAALLRIQNMSEEEREEELEKISRQLQEVRERLGAINQRLADFEEHYELATSHIAKAVEHGASLKELGKISPPDILVIRQYSALQHAQSEANSELTAIIARLMTFERFTEGARAVPPGEA